MRNADAYEVWRHLGNDGAIWATTPKPFTITQKQIRHEVEFPIRERSERAGDLGEDLKVVFWY
jgi:hypothetical protein